jgi:uncharacterized protein
MSKLKPLFIITLTALLSFIPSSVLLANDIEDINEEVSIEANTSKKIQRQFYYPDGKLEKIETWTFDESGKTVEHGPVINFYQNGKLKSRGINVQGQKSGPWVFVSEDGKITRGEYIANNKHGNWQVWTKDKQLIINENYFNDKLHGPRLTYYENGAQASEEFYVYGKKHGTLKKWYQSGQLASEVDYVDDTQHGNYFNYDSNGVLLVKGKFFAGTPDGYWEWRDLDGYSIKTSTFSNGTGILYEYTKAAHKKSKTEAEYKISLKREIPFNNYKIEGIQKTYYPTGQLETEISFKKGQKNGPFTEWYLNGAIKSQGEFYNNLPIKTVYTFHPQNDENIKEKPPVSKVVVYRENQVDALLTEYTKEGIKTLEMYLHNDRPHGTFKTFYAEGDVMTTGEFNHGKRTGEWKEYYANGDLHIQQSYTLDKKHGPLVEYYKKEEGQSEAQVKLEGTYFQGEKDGKFMEWYSNGSLAASKNYQHGTEDGSFLEYWPETDLKTLKRIKNKYRRNKRIEDLYKNKLKTEGFYVIGNKEGEWKTWFRNGLVKSKAHFKNGLQDGRAEEWYDYLVDSQHVVRLAGEYKAGIQTGKWESYYRNGQIETEQMYENGKLNGPMKYYYETGELKLSSNFKDSIQVDTQFEYYANGNKKNEVEFQNNQRHGDFIAYHPNGKLSIKGFYQGGVPVGNWEWYDDTGTNLLKTSSFDRGTGLMYEFYATGELKSQTQFVSGVKDGTETIWFESGQVKAKSNFRNGLLQGDYEEFHENGDPLTKTSWIYGKRNGSYESWFGNKQKQFELKFLDDRIHGPSTEWHENGALRSQGQWLHGHRHGEWTWYDRYGDRTLEQVYDFGLVVSTKVLKDVEDIELETSSIEKAEANR